MTTVEFTGRNGLGSVGPASTRIQFKVLNYSWHAVGGPSEAVIQAFGSPDDLAALLHWVRYHARITDNAGALVWWGYVSQVEVAIGNVTRTASIDEMYNRVAVAYTTLALGQDVSGERATTAWVEDASSISVFGRREMLDSIGNTNAAHAEARRDHILSRRKYPRAKVRTDFGMSSEAVATITCRGWWDTLEWLYCSVPTSLALGFSTIGTQTQTLGADYNEDSYNVISLAESFETGAASWNVQEIEIYCHRVGLPTGGITVGIAENPDNLTPGETLASGTIAAANIPATTPGWVRCSFSEPFELAVNTKYFVMVDFGDTPNQDNYYVFTLDSNQGFAGGTLRKRVDSDWTALTPAADMPFRLYTNDVIENSTQALNILRGFGQFFSAVHVEVTTGISTESYRNGDTDALEEMSILLETGTTNGRRLLSLVDENRVVRVFEEPVQAARYSMDENGNFWAGSTMVPPSTCPVGFWARDGVMPGSFDGSALSGLDLFFVEKATFDCETGMVAVEPDDAHDILDTGPQNG